MAGPARSMMLKPLQFLLCIAKVVVPHSSQTAICGTEVHHAVVPPQLVDSSFILCSQVPLFILGDPAYPILP